MHCDIELRPEETNRDLPYGAWLLDKTGGSKLKQTAVQGSGRRQNRTWETRSQDPRFTRDPGPGIKDSGMRDDPDITGDKFGKEKLIADLDSTDSDDDPISEDLEENLIGGDMDNQQMIIKSNQIFEEEADMIDMMQVKIPPSEGLNGKLKDLQIKESFEFKTQLQGLEGNKETKARNRKREKSRRSVEAPAVKTTTPEIRDRPKIDMRSKTKTGMISYGQTLSNLSPAKRKTTEKEHLFNLEEEMQGDGKKGRSDTAHDSNLEESQNHQDIPTAVAAEQHCRAQ